MMASCLLRLLKVVALASPFGLAAFLSFLLLLRVTSGTFMMRLASATDRLAERGPQDFKILAGLRSFRAGGTSDCETR